MTTMPFRILTRAVCVTFALFGAPIAFAAPAEFTIEQVMQAPYPASLTAAPVSKSVAWVFITKGVRNVWIADDANGMKARPLTAFTQDDGFDIGELDWSPDGRSIAFVRGGSMEDDQPANVHQSPQGPTPREVWIVSTAGGDARRIGAGHSPAYSPDGKTLAFIESGRVLSVSADASSEQTPLIIDSGKVTSILWSPDSKHLAFVSSRTRHSLVGLYDANAKSLTWMSPSLDFDQSPVFAPDSKHIAFIRMPSEKAPIFVSKRSGHPWSIWVADVATGQGRRAWVADEGEGSVFWTTLGAQNLFWTAKDELVFPWEKTGWLQLYSVPVGGGAAHAITSGTFEIGNIAISPDRRTLAWSSNEGDRDRSHIWTLDTTKGKPQQLAKSETIEASPQVTADGTVFALQSSGTQPLKPVMIAKGRWQALAADGVSATFPSSKLVEPQVITFKAKDGQESYAQLFVPKNVSGRRPALMFYHGGPRRQMLQGFHPMGAYNWMYAMNQYFVSRGYVVISVNFRGGIGYGLKYREAEKFGPDGASELNDLLGAVDYLKGRAEVDPARIGVWGGSYGGLMTALGLARASDSIAAGFDYSGVHNWVTLLAAYGQPPEGADAAKVAFESSPLATVDQWRSPVLIVQADDDRNVPLGQASELIEALRERRVEHEVIILPNEIHDMGRYSSWIKTFQAGDDFFARKLMNAR